MAKALETISASRFFRLKAAAEGVYAAINVAGAGSLGNAAIVDLGDATLVVDTTMNLEAARDLRRAAEELTGRPVAYVFNTHFHFDHIFGNQIFPEATFISTGKTRDIMSERIGGMLKQHLANTAELYAELDQYEKNIALEKDAKVQREMRWEVENERLYIRSLPELRMTLPAVTFEQELAIHGSRRTVRLMTYGGGHTPSDGFLYLPDDKLAILGDLVLSGYHPTMSHANPWEWQKILDRIAELGLETIIPGHGEICGMDTLRGVQAYLRFMIGLAAELDPGDEKLENVAVPEQYDEWLFRPDFKNNLRRIRELMRSKKD